MYFITGLMACRKSTVSDLLTKSLKKCAHLRYKLTADAAKSYFEDGFSVVIQDNYYGDELNRMLSYLHTYPAEAIVLCPNVEVIKERELHRGKTGYVDFTVEASGSIGIFQYWNKENGTSGRR